MKLLLLHAEDIEVKYLKWPYKFCVGINAVNLSKMPLDYDIYILTGTCGSLYRKRTNEFAVYNFYTIRYDEILNYDNARELGFKYIDMEVEIVQKFFEKLNKSLWIRKYILDFCDKPSLFHDNRIWHTFQHKRMQKKIQKELEYVHILA